MARFVLRDGTVTDVKPFDYSILRDQDDGVWCTVCEGLIPAPSNPMGGAVFDRQTSRFKHMVIAHLGRRSDG